MKFYRAAALIFGLCAGAWSSAEGAGAPPQLGLPADVMAAMHGIDPHRIGEHVRFLANDLLEGRGPGMRGGDIAANYIAAQFALAGLKPAGDNGSYLQKVDFVGVQTLPGTTAWLLPVHGAAMDLKLAEDWLPGDEFEAARTDSRTDIT